MNLHVKNENISVGEIEIGGAERSSLVLIGDAESITSCTHYDTPADSLIFKPLANQE